jgi:hypothetical protein
VGDVVGPTQVSGRHGGAVGLDHVRRKIHVPFDQEELRIGWLRSVG